MNAKYIDNLWDKISNKMKKTVERNKTNIPYTTRDGHYDNRAEEDITWWTNGFWPGLLWLMYSENGDSIYRETAEHSEKLLDEALKNYKTLHHDVGFMWHLSSTASYRLTGNEESKNRALFAASILASRFNLSGNFIRAWNGINEAGWTIIDCMMNISLLYWASKESNDPRFTFIAKAHADMTLKDHVRDDGSIRHIVVHDPVTGEVLEEMGGQGYAVGSSWSRGQAWGLYGFVLSYIHTGEKRYLDAAKKISHYFISCICDDWIPRCDFRAPKEPIFYDTSAGAIAACGLIELSRVVDEYEKDLYLNAAENIIKAMDKNFCDWDDDTDAIVQKFTSAYHLKEHKNIPVVYADFFFIESVLKLKNNDFLIW